MRVKGIQMAEDSTLYSFKVSSALMDQCDQVAEALGKNQELFPTGTCKRADVVRLCVVKALRGLALEHKIKIK